MGEEIHEKKMEEEQKETRSLVMRQPSCHRMSPVYIQCILSDSSCHLEEHII